MSQAHNTPMAFQKQMAKGLAGLRLLQFANGGVATFRPSAEGEMLLGASPRISALVHDLLGDLSPPWSFGLAKSLQRQAEQMRRALRSYLAWQESSVGLWSPRGRAPDVEPDLATSACAAIALDRPWRRARQLAAFRSRKWPHSPRHAVHALRYFALSGEDLEPWLSQVLSTLSELLERQNPRDLPLAQALARAWPRNPRLEATLGDDLPTRLKPWLAKIFDDLNVQQGGQQGGRGESDGDRLLSLALLTHTWLDLDLDEPRKHECLLLLESAIERNFGRDIEPYEHERSPALLQALILSALARSEQDRRWDAA